jgi:transketolase
MVVTTAQSNEDAIPFLKRKALDLRRNMLTMARGKGQGYIGQALGIADLLAALYFHALRYDPDDPTWPERDRFLLSTGHYAIALWAALVEAGILSRDELPGYGSDHSRLEMSAMDTTPGSEIIGGSLGHGLGQGVGMALGCRMDGRPAQIYVELSDGELQEGSTWEAAMAAGHFGLDNLTALVDRNGIQADGPLVMTVDPIAPKWRAFGWDALEIDGNDMGQITAALELARLRNGRPKAIVLRTTPGKGIPSLERRERAHFVRLEDSEWDRFARELEEHADV